MKKQLIPIILILASQLLYYNCSNSDDGSSNNAPPGMATLVFPDNAEECTEGSNFTETESDILFEWGATANTTNYQVVLTNLNTQETSQFESNTAELSIRVLRATPYSWYVVSRNSTPITAQSSTWTFYNAGEATTAYAPFPAAVVAPAMGATLNTTTSVFLEWNSSDVDDDVAHHDVFFGTTNPPTTTIGEAIVEQRINTAVTSGNTYYWSVVTTDATGNTSTSRVFSFKVQ